MSRFPLSRLHRFGHSWSLPAALSLALAVRLLPTAINVVVGTDEALYLTLGQNLAAGLGLTELARMLEAAILRAVEAWGAWAAGPTTCHRGGRLC